MGHSHPPRRHLLVLAAVANGALLVAQVIGGVVFDSLALLADAVHQASDVFSLVLAVFVAGIAARPPSARYTFGFGRADALGGLAHVVLLFAGAALVLVEAIRRFGDDITVDGTGVVILAVVGLVINGGSAGMLHSQHNHSLNMEGAVLHLVADALGSFVVLVAGLVIITTDATWVDPVGSLVVAAIIVWSAVGLAKSSVLVLLDGVPPSVDVEHLRRLMMADEVVEEAHHVHVRSINGADLSLTAHVRVEADSLHDAQVITERLTASLAEEGVGHVTLQVECHPCADADCD